jgi:hypothetical protein
MKGHFTPHTEETKLKIRFKKLGIPSGKKGKKFPQYSGVNSRSWKGGWPKCSVCNIEIGRGAKTCLTHRDMKTIVEKRAVTRLLKGNYPAWNKGQKGFMAGPKHYNWKGGITPIHNTIRGSLEYKLWQESVLSRDGHICQKCGEDRVKYLTAHHILNFSNHIELRFAIDNGVTFCRLCHKEFHKRYKKRNNNLVQVHEFLTSIT